MAPIPRFPCLDCQVNTVPLDGNREYYEVHDEIWLKAVPYAGTIGQADHGSAGEFLCIGCLEERLGRQLVKADFKPFPANQPSPWYSDRLNSRLCLYNRDKALWQQYHPKALTDAVHSVDGFTTYLDTAGALTAPRYQPLTDAIMEIPDAHFVINGEPWQEKRNTAETDQKA